MQLLLSILNPANRTVYINEFGLPLSLTLLSFPLTNLKNLTKTANKHEHTNKER